MIVHRMRPLPVLECPQKWHEAQRILLKYFMQGDEEVYILCKDCNEVHTNVFCPTYVGKMCPGCEKPKEERPGGCTCVGNF